MNAALDAATWPELAARSSLLAVPLGSCEQHGPHLPFGTDTLVAAALAERLAAGRPDVVIAPALPYGASGEHAAFPGTLSLGTDALRRVVVELVRSADAFAGVVLVSGHGGNAEAVGGATALLRREGRRVLAWSPSLQAAAGGAGAPDAHAGFVETSVLLAVAPHLVRRDRAEAGATAALPSILASLRAGGVAAVAPNGVLGDPEGATASEGRRILDAWAADLHAAVAAWWAGR